MHSVPIYIFRLCNYSLKNWVQVFHVNKATWASFYLHVAFQEHDPSVSICLHNINMVNLILHHNSCVKTQIQSEFTKSETYFLIVLTQYTNWVYSSFNLNVLKLLHKCTQFLLDLPESTSQVASLDPWYWSGNQEMLTLFVGDNYSFLIITDTHNGLLCVTYIYRKINQPSISFP